MSNPNPKSLFKLFAITTFNSPETFPFISIDNPVAESLESMVIVFPPPVNVLPEFITNELTLGASPSNVTS